MKRVIGNIFTMFALFLFGIVFCVNHNTNRILAEQEKTYQQCEAAGHTREECDKFWIKSGEYKKVGSVPSKVWVDFLTPVPKGRNQLVSRSAGIKGLK